MPLWNGAIFPFAFPILTKETLVRSYWPAFSVRQAFLPLNGSDYNLRHVATHQRPNSRGYAPALGLGDKKTFAFTKEIGKVSPDFKRKKTFAFTKEIGKVSPDLLK